MGIHETTPTLLCFFNGDSNDHLHQLSQLKGSDFEAVETGAILK